MKNWILAVLIACGIILVICGAISALASLAENHEIIAAIIFFGAIIALISILIKKAIDE